MFTFFVFLGMVRSPVIVPADTVITTKTKHVSDCVHASSGHVDEFLIMCRISEYYRSGRSSLFPSFTLTAVCMRLKRIRSQMIFRCAQTTHNPRPSLPEKDLLINSS